MNVQHLPPAGTVKYIHHGPKVNSVPPPRPAWRRGSTPRFDHRAQRGDGADIVAIRNAVIGVVGEAWWPPAINAHGSMFVNTKLVRI